MPIKGVLLCGLALSSIATLPAQTDGVWNKAYSKANAKSCANAHGYADVGFAPTLMSIRGKPFTAKWTVSDQPQENGSDIGNPLTAECTIARDDKGRIHYEMAFESARAGQDVIEGFDIQIYDPVAHTLIRYFANARHSLPAEPVATVRRLKLMSELASPLPAASKQNTEDDSPISQVPEQPDEAEKQPAPEPPIIFVPLKDNMPIESIDGIIVVGHRVVLKYGPKRQFFQIQENWFSPDYALDLRQTLLRETMGTETVEAKDILDGEPDPALFQIPPGYIVKKEE